MKAVKWRRKQREQARNHTEEVRRNWSYVLYKKKYHELDDRQQSVVDSRPS